MPNPQHAILTNLEKYQWYTHLSRTEGADLGVIKKAIKEARAAGSETGVTVPVNVCILFGPTLLADLTGFIDGTGNPEPEDQYDRGIIPDGEKGAGGSFCIAQRWVHDLDYFNGLSLEDQENTFGRTKKDSTKLPTQVPTSHLAHVELREGTTGDDGSAKRGEMVRRSTPYAFHDGTVGLYFMGFCKEQAPLRERMEAIYGINCHDGAATT